MYRGIFIDEDGIRHGCLIEDECKFEESRAEYNDYIIIPTFFNAHTHLADSIAKEAPFKPLRELVSPPNGYKFKVLKEYDINSLRKCVKIEVEVARRYGTVYFLDFRETDLEVVKGIKGVIPLARPKSVEEAETIDAFGFGMSSTRDHDLEFLEKLRKIAKRRKMIFAIHAGEIDCEDVDNALDLEPDLIVHMNFCPEKLKDVIDLEIPVVSCIRSNAFFGLLNPKSYEILKEYDLWLLGTDNAMISSASILDELHFASLVVKDDLKLFKASIRGNRVFGFSNGFIVFNRDYNFKNSKDVIATIVRRANYIDIEKVVYPYNFNRAIK